jgi:hypothetical protein
MIQSLRVASRSLQISVLSLLDAFVPLEAPLWWLMIAFVRPTIAAPEPRTLLPRFTIALASD